MIHWQLGNLYEWYKRLEIEYHLPPPQWTEETLAQECHSFYQQIQRRFIAGVLRLSEDHDLSVSSPSSLLEHRDDIEQLRYKIALFHVKQAAQNHFLYCQQQGRDWSFEQLKKEIRFHARCV